MEILEKMLEVETEARQIVEKAKTEANAIRKKAREDAKQLVIDGKKKLQEKIQQEIKKMEEEAAAKKASIIQEMETHLAETEQTAKPKIESSVEHVMSVLLKK